MFMNEPAKKSGGYIILIVDDNEAYRKTLSLVLTTEGFRVIQAGHGTEALALMGLDTPDLILSDVHMPVMDGIVFLDWIKKDPRYTQIPVVMLTNVQEELDNAVKHGAEEGILKATLTPKQVAMVCQKHLVVRV